MTAELTEHLFRHEAARMVATLTRIFGVENLSLAEDVVQEAFCRALEIWKFRGIPQNPSAWLMTAAKHLVLDALRRERTRHLFEPDLIRILQDEYGRDAFLDGLFEAKAMQDDYLRTMFSCCHIRLPEEVQVALILNILCGFSVDEVSNAFMSSRAAIYKRISRGKKVLAGSQRLFDVTDESGFRRRLPAVQRALYLLFNEGYHGSSHESAVRFDLCREAIRLTMLLIEHPLANTPSTRALGALMHLNAARLPARLVKGSLVPLLDQDRSQWDSQLLEGGWRLFEQSIAGKELTEYHIEAAIAAVHAATASTTNTDWRQIVSLYNSLIEIRPSPVVALSRAIAIAHCEGPRRGLEEIRRIENVETLSSYPFYHAALGELELRMGNSKTAAAHFLAAVASARNPEEREFLVRRAAACTVPSCQGTPLRG